MSHNELLIAVLEQNKHILHRMEQLEKIIMTLSDAITGLQTSVSNNTAAINTAITALQNAGASPAQIAAIAAASSALDSATASLNTAVATPPATPAS